MFFSVIAESLKKYYKGGKTKLDKSDTANTEN